VRCSIPDKLAEPYSASFSEIEVLGDEGAASILSRE
jgi:hypothetical protein